MSKKKDRAEEQAGSAGGEQSAALGAYARTPERTPGGSPGGIVRAAAPDQISDARKPAADAGSPSPAEGEASAQAPAVPNAEERARALEAEVLDLRDKLLRKQADFENSRKRMIRERDEAARYANAALLTDVIATIDDFERAIRSAEESRDFASFLQGVSMIEKQLLETLESRWGLKRFSSTGESFDPNRHEAVLRVEGPADSRPTVVEDFQKGYYLHERVLRPARVKVMVPASQEAAAGTAGASEAPGQPGEAR
jgi:molecular chaperone GrpE